ncbi:MAG: energy-coupling factor transporter transmembrane protein EcfT [Ruminococcus sp.]|nr:energy-coupling factor transporter transmembrane protein EcfT [Ruminococcus sp.]
MIRSIEDSNPIVTLFFFAYTAGLTMFLPYPPLIVISLIGAAAYFASVRGERKGSFTLFAVILFLLLVIANSLVSHKGQTVLLFINSRPITLESFYFGLNSALMIIAALYWFRTLTFVFTSDKLIYLTSVLSKDLSLIISMSVRFVPLFTRQRKKIKETQLAMGLYNDDSLTHEIRSNIRIFSILITWALEGGITTADSMEARGFSLPKRTCYRKKRFDRLDALLLAAMTGLFAVAVMCASKGFEYSFYPKTRVVINNSTDIAGLSAFAVLSMMPVILKGGVSARWKYLQRRV